MRQFVREQVVPEVGDWFERGILPREVIAGARRSSACFGMHLEGYGLPGRERRRVRPDVPRARGGRLGHPQRSSRCRARWRCSRSGAGAPRSRSSAGCRAMHAGEVIGCFGLTEPDAGSDPGAMRTHARRDGADWVLNGTKMWITNGSIADVAIVWARTDDGEISGFVVDRGHAGLQRTRDPQEDLAARLGHVRARAGRRPRARRERCLPEVDDAARAALVPERGALRHRLGRRRRRPRLLRGGARLRAGADVFGEADRRVPAHAAEARGDGARAQPRHCWWRCTSAG